jgi:hypothetical protein
MGPAGDVREQVSVIVNSDEYDKVTLYIIKHNISKSREYNNLY